MGELQLMVVAIACVAALIVVALVLWLRARVHVPPGSALVVFGGREPRVTFVDTIVPPFVARAELVDCAKHTIAIVCEGKDSLRCADQIRVDVRAEAVLGINPTAEDVLKAVQTLGTKRAIDRAALQERFAGKIVHGIASVLPYFALHELATRREELRGRALEVIDYELDGFKLFDLSFTRLEQVPVEQLDPDDILDAEAIRCITERTSRDNLRRQELEAETQLRLTKHKLEMEEHALTLQLAHERMREDRG